MCWNSAKVQLNLGTLERRHQALSPPDLLNTCLFSCCTSPTHLAMPVQVCWNSAQVKLNPGILEGRHTVLAQSLGANLGQTCRLLLCMQLRLTMHAQVCWNSAKVQLNSGILERRHKHWPKAPHHSPLPRTLEPGYCEPDYWVGATMINAGMDVDAGLKVCPPP